MQAAPSGMFLSFEGILSSVDNAGVNPYEKHSSQISRSLGGPMESMSRGAGISSPSGKNRWALLKSIIPFSSQSNNSNRKMSTKSDTSETLSAGPHRTDAPDHLPTKGAISSETRVPPYRSLSFKFSLEWADKNKSSSTQERRLTPPRLPPMAEAYRKGQKPQFDLYEPLRPEGSAIASSKYTGRAIAEWGLLITECRNFFERRKAEGVPTFHLVEIPSLSVAPFRKS